jgi:putative heme-binding domain-containing protein
MTARRMMWSWVACSLLLVGGVARGQDPQLVAETEPITAAEQLTKFHLPPGFKIELVAAEPVCRKPMNLKFDAAGRLWFTQSIEYPWPVKEGESGRDTIQVMTDTNGDSVPDTAATFADGLNIPIGITPVHGGVLGYSIPTLYFFPDENGDARAETRSEYYRTFGFRDTHGMCSSLNWWIDGWVYGCHGFANDSEVAGADGRPIKMQSGNTYRLRPDGSRIEYVSHGQVNPFGMCFDPLGNQYTSDCHTKPAYLILRGAYYPSFGKPHDGLGFGPELLQHLHGSTGIAGIVYYAATHFPAEYRDNLFIGNPVTGRINRDTLEQRGSTYQAIEQPDFLSCDDPWFRPVDVQLAPDGSLYIADFYNRIIGHYEVPLTHPGRDRERGRIWRVSYVGTDGATRAPVIPDLTTLSASDLVTHLGHPHLPVRVQATHQLVHRLGSEAVAAVQSGMHGLSADGRMHALWVLERLQALSAESLAKFAADESRLVRVHAAKVLAERAEWSAADRALLTGRLLEDADPFVRRAAVDAWGRHPEPGLEARLLDLWGATQTNDTLLIHTLKIAIRDALVNQQSYAELDVSTWSAERRARLAEVLLGAPRPEAAALSLKLAALGAWPIGLAEPLVQHAVRYAPEDQAAALADVRTHYQTQPEMLQLMLLRAAMRGSQERGRPLEAGWRDWAVKLGRALLGRADPQPIRAALEFSRDLQLTELAEDVSRYVGADADAGLRPLAVQAWAVLDSPALVPTLGGLLTNDGIAVDQRQAIAQVLGSLNRDPAREVLLTALKSVPGNVALGVGRGLVATPRGAEQLLEAVEQGKASARLLQDATIQDRLRQARLHDYDARHAKLVEGLPPEDAAVAEQIAARKAAFLAAQTDLAAGKRAYEKVCVACHRLGGQGGKVGPELDGVGLRGLERLLEDTLDPSRNVDAAFRSSTIVMQSGKVWNGLVAREEGAVLILIDEAGKEVSLPLAEIEERQTTRLSPMPANVGDKLTPEEYQHLLAFLMSQRIAPKPAP